MTKAIELQEVHLLESVNICGLTGNHFNKNHPTFDDLRMTYLGEVILFERPGHSDEVISTGALLRKAKPMHDTEPGDWVNNASFPAKFQRLKDTIPQPAPKAVAPDDITPTVPAKAIDIPMKTSRAKKKPSKKPSKK
jgi:hypothetical protein